MKALSITTGLLLLLVIAQSAAAQTPVSTTGEKADSAVRRKIDSIARRKTDSIAGALKKQVSGAKAALEAPLHQIALPKESVSIGQVKQVGKAQLDSVLGMAGSPLQQIGQISQGVKIFEGGKPVTFNQLTAEADYSYFQDTAAMGPGAFRNMAGAFGYSIDYGVTLTSLPFAMSIRESNGINTMSYTPFQNFYKFNFDHQQYIESIKAKLMQKLSPEMLMNSALSRVNVIRRNYEQQLQGEIAHIQGDLSNQYRSAVSVPAGATNLGSSDMTALRTQLLPGSATANYQSNLARLQNMQQTRDGKTLGTDSSYANTLGEAKKYEAMEKIYARIVAYKKRFEDNPLVRELRSQSPFSPGAMKSFLSDPKNLGQVLDDQESLNTIQKLFYNIQKLDLGQNAVQSGELGMQNVVNSGVNTEFKNRSTSVGVIYGQNNSVNNWQQAGLTSQVTNEYSNLTGFKLGTGTGSPLDQSISFNFFHFNNANTSQQPGGISSYLPMAPRQDGVISLHSGFQFGGVHNITIDLSKSFGSFQQGGGTDSLGLKSPVAGTVFNNAGKANYAGILGYTGQLFKTDVKIYLKKVGLGYNNPGNALLHSGASEIGLGLARKFLGQRLTVKYDGDYRRQVFDPAQNYTFSNFSNKLQAAWKITRSDRISLTYQHSDYQSDFYGQAPMNGSNTRLQLDGNYHFIIDRKRVTSTFSIARQEMNMPQTIGGNYTDNSVLITNTSSMMVGKNLLSLTVLSNQSNNKSYYFNTSMLNTETNYSYGLANNIRMSSGLGYYVNYGWNEQVGIKQQVSAALSGKINTDLNLVFKKAVEVIQPLLANQVFVSAVVRYSFK